MGRIKINLNTGTAWTKSIVVDGRDTDDLLQLIDDYFMEHRELPVQMWTYWDLVEHFTSEDYSIDENGLSIALDEMLPINGGEFYIDGIDSIEYLD